jgi:hypothetical protein
MLELGIDSFNAPEAPKALASEEVWVFSKFATLLT